MDLFLIAFLAIVSLLACLILGLSAVGFGRVQLAAAALYFTAFVVLMCAVTSTQALLSPPPKVDDVDRMLAQSRLLFTVSEIAFNTSMAALLVFVVSGTARIWNHRKLLFTRVGQFAVARQDNGTESAETRLSHTQNPLRYLLIVPLLCWALYDFCYNDRGLAYFSKQPHMLLYVVVTAVIIAAFLTGIAWYGKRVWSPTSRTPP